jgi:hypothetical protein
MISDEQWLAALAWHWSDRTSRIGETIVACGFLPDQVVESEARVFHNNDVEVAAVGPRGSARAGSRVHERGRE